MTFPTREDRNARDARLVAELQRIKVSLHDDDLTLKPRLDWLLLTVLAADLGLWVGLLAWWIWR